MLPCRYMIKTTTYKKGDVLISRDNQVLQFKELSTIPNSARLPRFEFTTRTERSASVSKMSNFIHFFLNLGVDKNHFIWLNTIMTESQRLELIANAVAKTNKKVDPKFQDLLADLLSEKLVLEMAWPKQTKKFKKSLFLLMPLLMTERKISRMTKILLTWIASSLARTWILNERKIMLTAINSVFRQNRLWPSQSQCTRSTEALLKMRTLHNKAKKPKAVQAHKSWVNSSTAMLADWHKNRMIYPLEYSGRVGLYRLRTSQKRLLLAVQYGLEFNHKRPRLRAVDAFACCWRVPSCERPTHEPIRVTLDNCVAM